MDMKKIICCGGLFFYCTIAFCQQKQGKVLYDRTAQMRINLSEEEGGEQVRTRTDKFELNFTDNKSLWKAAEKENDEAENINRDGMQIRMVVAGSDDVLFNDLGTGKTTELRVFFDKKFIIDDSTRKLRWKIGEETKIILNHTCRKATATTVNPRMMMNINNGKMERKEIQDTAAVTAWFTDEIPVSAGPGEYQGQLPGLILALDVNNGRVVYQATNISEKADVAVIKEPSGKKHYNPDEFRKERNKMMEEMQQNNRGGNTQIRIQ
jgi:GLPGLI family protein